MNIELKDIHNIENKYFMQTYKRSDLIIKKAKNQFIWDIYNKRYLDFTAGISVCNLGHCNELIIEAIKEQLNYFVHISNLYYAPIQMQFGKKIIDNTTVFKNSKIFLSNSGAEANECAIKLARKWGFINKNKVGNRYEIICFKNSFHGRTMATISATGQNKFHNYLLPLQEKFIFAEHNNIDSVYQALNKRTVAIMIEPIQGEGGVIPFNNTFLHELRNICDNKNLLLIFDEIQCAVGRTGKFYAFENFNVTPDIITLAKALANGLPLGATIATSKCAEAFIYGDHGSTFGGNPVSCAAGLAVLNIINNELLNNVCIVSQYLNQKLHNLKKEYSIIKDIRGIGLMIGIELSIDDGQDIMKYCLGNGLLVTCTHNNVIRLLPPLIITQADVDFAITIMEAAFKWKTKMMLKR
ncbi:MAG: aspartate aminotransferase family protein [Endomicrobium sp.]|jgi:predicted acetylornithine/succinylornithine family transaminase|nr:aspartate aminotransferase family protein [Endomicrobium sp.]